LKAHATALPDPAHCAPSLGAVGAPYVQRLSVSFEYPVYFTRDAFDLDNPVLFNAITRLEPCRRHRVYAVVDAGLREATPGLLESIERYARHHQASLELVAVRVVPGGEQVKRANDHVAQLQQSLYEHAIDRQSFVLIVGGGAVQDMAGYAAAAVHRGVRVVRMPTTVGSQNDSGVGVKNGINAFGIKNFLGSFAPPFAVINDAAFLDTLPPRERTAGIAEAVKVALLRDRLFYEWLYANRGELAAFAPAAVEYMIRRSAELHLDHIAQSGDPFECGSAKPLDFGHWSAHKLESLSDHRVRHGEAVAIGVALDCRYAVEVGLLAEGICTRVCELLEGLGFRLWCDEMGERDTTGRPWLFDGIAEFREHLGGDLSLTMISEVGAPYEVRELQPARMEAALAWLEARQHRK